MATMAKAAARNVELEPIDRLEEKIKALIGMVDRLKTEQARTANDNERLAREVEALRGRLASADTLSSEVLALKDERDVIRGRVSDMLQQLEALNL